MSGTHCCRKTGTSKEIPTTESNVGIAFPHPLTSVFCAVLGFPTCVLCCFTFAGTPEASTLRARAWEEKLSLAVVDIAALKMSACAIRALGRDASAGFVAFFTGSKAVRVEITPASPLIAGLGLAAEPWCGNARTGIPSFLASGPAVVVERTSASAIFAALGVAAHIGGGQANTPSEVTLARCDPFIAERTSAITRTTTLGIPAVETRGVDRRNAGTSCLRG